MYLYKTECPEHMQEFHPLDLDENTVRKLIKEKIDSRLYQAEYLYLAGQLLNAHEDNPVIYPGDFQKRYDQKFWTTDTELVNLFCGKLVDAGFVVSPNETEPGFLDTSDVAPTYLVSDKSYEKWFQRFQFRYMGIYAYNHGHLNTALHAFENTKEDLFCMEMAAQMRYYGIGCSVNEDKGIYWQEMTAGHPSNEIQAKITLGLMYYKAQKDYKKEAFRIFRKMAETAHIPGIIVGDKIAQRMAGIMLLNGIGTEKNTKEGMRLLEESGRRGDSEAQCLLGEIYEKGILVQKDLQKAQKWYGEAAAQGNALAKEAKHRLL